MSKESWERERDKLRYEVDQAIEGYRANLTDEDIAAVLDEIAIDMAGGL